MKATLFALMMLAASGAGAASPSPVVVTTDSEIPVARVAVSGADFASPAARSSLDRRIRSAIETLCGSYAAIETSQVMAMDACWDDAHAQVKAQLPLVQAAATPMTIRLLAR